MKYMLLIHYQQQASGEYPDWSDEDLRTMVSYMRELDAELRESGELMDAQGLRGPANAKMVRTTHGTDPVVTDGPFAEAKEVLAGFWLVDVASEARVLEIAARVSATPGPGGAPVDQPVQVHQIGVAPDV
jgi:hypothetical protein